MKHRRKIKRRVYLKLFRGTSDIGDEEGNAWESVTGERNLSSGLKPQHTGSWERVGRAKVKCYMAEGRAKKEIC